MQIKSGTIGYVNLKRGWTKCVVQRQAGMTLVVRVAPRLDGQIVHIEQFLPESQFRALKFFKAQKLSPWRKIAERLAFKVDFLKCKLRRKNKRFDFDSIILTDSVGWAKTYARGFIFLRNRWRRSLVLKQEKYNLTLCCAPEFSVVKVHVDNFLVDDSDPQIRIKKHPINLSSK